MSHPLDRRQALAALGLLAATPALRAQGTQDLSADEARRELRILRRALFDLHPGLTRYTGTAALEAAFAQAADAVAGGIGRGGMLLLVSRLAAAVHCGHTWAGPYNARADLKALLGRQVLPFTLRWVQARALVTGSMAAVPAGAELLAIGGVPVAEIAQALLPALRADGLHPGATAKRLSQLDSGATGGAMDRLFPQLQPPREGAWGVRWRARGASAPQEATVQAVSQAARDAALPPASSAWALDVQGDTAVLTLPTFAFWQGGFDWRAFIVQAFERIAPLPFLVIDQRRNEGGDSAVGQWLLAQLLRAPHEVPAPRVESAYERVPYDLARFLETWDYGFFDRTGRVTRAAAGRNWLLPPGQPQRVEPAARPYRGRTLVLTGPVNSSAGYLFARELKASGAATLLGQGTGGNLRGLNGGQLCWLTLPHSGVAVDIPLLASFNPGDPPDAGVLPDVAVAPSFDDAAAGIDTEMAAAQRVIAGWRR